MIKILANDGIHPDGLLLLEEASYLVSEDKIAQDDLPAGIADYDVLIVRSATKVNKAVIDAGKAKESRNTIESQKAEKGTLTDKQKDQLRIDEDNLEPFPG